MLPGLMRELVTLKRPLYSDTDRYGDDAPVWHDMTSWTEVRAYVAPLSTTEDQSDMERRASDYRFMFMADVELEADWRMEWNGQDYEVIGKPALFSTPRGGHHYEVTGRLVEG